MTKIIVKPCFHSIYVIFSLTWYILLFINIQSTYNRCYNFTTNLDGFITYHIQLLFFWFPMMYIDVHMYKSHGVNNQTAHTHHSFYMEACFHIERDWWIFFYYVYMFPAKNLCTHVNLYTCTHTYLHVCKSEKTGTKMK